MIIMLHKLNKFNTMHTSGRSGVHLEAKKEVPVRGLLQFVMQSRVFEFRLRHICVRTAAPSHSIYHQNVLTLFLQ